MAQAIPEIMRSALQLDCKWPLWVIGRDKLCNQNICEEGGSAPPLHYSGYKIIPIVGISWYQSNAYKGVQWEMHYINTVKKLWWQHIKEGWQLEQLVATKKMISQEFDKGIIEEIRIDEIGIERDCHRKYEYMIATP